MALVADTSALYASIDADEQDHDSVRALIEAEAGLIHVPELVLAELDYLVLTRLGRKAELAFLEDVLAGAYTREPLLQSDLTRAVEVVRQYSQHDIGLTDATVLATAERLNVVRILTLDERHFRTFRFKGRRSLTLLPVDG